MEVSVVIPPMHIEGVKRDARSWLIHQQSLGKTDAEIRAAFLALPTIKGDELKALVTEQKAKEKQKKSHPGGESTNGQAKLMSKSNERRPGVLLGMDESVVASEVVKGIAQLGWRKGESPQHRIYQRASLLVHIVQSEAKLSGVCLAFGSLRIRSLPRSVLRERISTAVKLYVETEDGHQQCRPPEWLCKAVHDRGEWQSIRPLAAIIRTPTLRPDGSVLQTPGYDKSTGILYVPDGEYPTVKENPSRDDAIQSANDLLEVVCDFEFINDDHKSVWLATVLTMVARLAIDGCVPLFAYDANARGTGKSLLTDVAGLITYGEKLPRKTWPRDDEEIRKTITSIALEGVLAVLWDNVASTLGSASLDAAITGTTWQDRILSTNTTTGALPLTTVWLASGNNLSIGADTARRTLLCRLESSHENPEDRSDFRHPNLLAWVREHRHRLAVAGLTILRAYIAAGRPDQNLVPWGSFEEWSNLIRGSIVWAELADPANTRMIVREADRSTELLRLLVAGIQEVDSIGGGVTSGEIERLLSHPIQPDEHDPYPILREAISECCDEPTARKIGNQLRKYIGRVCGGLCLAKIPGRARTNCWTVQSVTSGVSGESGESSGAPPNGNQKTSVVNKKVATAEIDTPHTPDTPTQDRGGDSPLDASPGDGNGDCEHEWKEFPTPDGFDVYRFCLKCKESGGRVGASGGGASR